MAIQVHWLKSNHDGSGGSQSAGSKSHQVIALHSSILGDSVDSELRVSYRQIISICRLSTWHGSGACLPYLRNGHWIGIRMNLDNASGGDIEPQWYWFESEPTQVSIRHLQPHRTPPNAVGRVVLSSLQSPQWGLILRQSELWLRSSLRAADNKGWSSYYNE
jgi:hypothetical protein